MTRLHHPHAAAASPALLRFLPFLRCLLWLTLGLTVHLTGCAPMPPRRTADFSPPSADCQVQYGQHQDGRSIANPQDPCWQRPVEHMPDYDLVVAEFDEQGWEAGAGIHQVLEHLTHIQTNAPDQRLSLVVFVHGWKHSAAADDGNMRTFRRLLHGLAQQEKVLPTGQRRVVGLYVGWRGGSIDVPLLDALTFWERKSTAEKVAVGAVRELFASLDKWRDDRAPRSQQEKNKIRMLTIGHSFGGLIVLNTMTGEFIGSVVRKPQSLSRLGDLVVVVNPALEGTRYEALHATASRVKQYRSDKQYPVLVTITGQDDQATRLAFPAARALSTMFEPVVSPAQQEANVQTLGHNPRYITHTLRTCDPTSADCTPAACASESIDSQARDEAAMVERLVAQPHFGTHETLCRGLLLESNDRWQPKENPFWVVSATGDVIRDHGDIENPRLLSFIRVLYGLITEVVH